MKYVREVPAHPIDEDHAKLAHMVSSLSAVIAHGGSPAIVGEAIAVLRERLRLHFHMEEILAGRTAPARVALLRGDHAGLLARLDRMAAMASGGGKAVGAELDAFLAAFKRHEDHVDAAIFKTRA